MILVHDPRDPEAMHAAQLLQPVLHNTCGLKTHVTERDSSDVMSRARQLLFLLGKEGKSREVSTNVLLWIKRKGCKRCKELRR